MNSRGGPWAFWIEVKGPTTKVGPDQVELGYKLMAAGMPWFVVRHPNDLAEILELLEFTRLEMDFRGDYPREADVQRSVKKVLETRGFTVIDTSQGYRPGGRRHGTTRITKGTPDLFCFRHRYQIRAH